MNSLGIATPFAGKILYLLSVSHQVTDQLFLVCKVADSHEIDVIMALGCPSACCKPRFFRSEVTTERCLWISKERFERITQNMEAQGSIKLNQTTGVENHVNSNLRA